MEGPGRGMETEIDDCNMVKPKLHGLSAGVLKRNRTNRREGGREIDYKDLAPQWWGLAHLDSQGGPASWRPRQSRGHRENSLFLGDSCLFLFRPSTD